MENMERFTPLYAIVNSVENLHFDKEGYFYELFYRRNREHFPSVPICYINTCGRTQNTVETLALL